MKSNFIAEDPIFQSKVLAVNVDWYSRFISRLRLCCHLLSKKVFISMRLEPTFFTIHNLEEFPFVVFNQDAAYPGYASQWQLEMIALLENGRPFVVVYDQLRADELHEDRKQRGIWLKNNKQALGHVCKALISIEPDEEQRRHVEGISEIAVKAFGIPHAAVATRDEAKAYMQRIIADAG